MSIESAAAASQTHTDTDRQIAVMKKALDAQTDQAEALVQLVRQSAPMPPHVGTRLNVIA